MSGIVHFRLDENFSHLPSASFIRESLIPGENAKSWQELGFFVNPEDFPVGTTERIRG